MGGAAPPICNHSARMVGFKKKRISCQARFAKGASGGARDAARPVRKHTARMVNEAVSKRLIGGWGALRGFSMTLERFEEFQRIYQGF